jgi:hypothetical protein
MPPSSGLSSCVRELDVFLFVVLRTTYVCTGVFTLGLGIGVAYIVYLSIPEIFARDAYLVT